MNRRGFLTLVGAFAAGAALPKALLSEKIARLTAGWVTPEMVSVYRVSFPLEAGSYTFTAACWDAAGQNLGMYVGGVKAEGGETLFEQPTAGYTIKNPKLIKGGLTYNLNGETTIEFTEHVIDKMDRGVSTQRT